MVGVTYADARVRRVISQDFLFHELSIEQDPGLISRLKVSIVPMMLVVAVDESIAGRVVGFLPPEELLERLTQWRMTALRKK